MKQVLVLVVDQFHLNYYLRSYQSNIFYTSFLNMISVDFNVTNSQLHLPRHTSTPAAALGVFVSPDLGKF